jgi:hypothetical protein
VTGNRPLQVARTSYSVKSGWICAVFSQIEHQILTLRIWSRLPQRAALNKYFRIFQPRYGQSCNSHLWPKGLARSRPVGLTNDCFQVSKPVLTMVAMYSPALRNLLIAPRLHRHEPRKAKKDSSFHLSPSYVWWASRESNTAPTDYEFASETVSVEKSR